MNQEEAATAVIGAAIEVHRELGPGLLESAYETCLCRELRDRGIPHRQQVGIPLIYKGESLDEGYRADLLVAEVLLVELKTVDAILDIHTAQVLTYLRLCGLQLGLLLNFKVPAMRLGIRRVIL